MPARTSYKNDPNFWWGYSRSKLQLRLDYESTASLLERQFSDMNPTEGQIAVYPQDEERALIIRHTTDKIGPKNFSSVCLLEHHSQNRAKNCTLVNQAVQVDHLEHQ